MTKNNRKKAAAQAISTAVALGWVIMQVESAQAATLTGNSVQINASEVIVNNDTNVTPPSNGNNFGEITFGGNISVRGGSIIVNNSGQINGGGNNSGAGGSIIIDNSGQINGGGNNSRAGGSITITTRYLIVTRVPEPSAIAGVILAGGLAWLTKRKQVFISKDSE